MYKNVGTRIPNHMVKEIEYLAYEENSDKSRIIRDLLATALKNKLFEVALEKYSKGEVSLGRAAELARLALADFMKLTAERKVSLHYSAESLEEDFTAALSYATSHRA